MCLSHVVIEPGYSWHLPLRYRPESLSTYAVVFVIFSTGSLISEIFSDFRHNIKVPSVFQRPGSHGMVQLFNCACTVSMVVLAYLVIFRKYGVIPHRLC